MDKTPHVKFHPVEGEYDVWCEIIRPPKGTVVKINVEDAGGWNMEDDKSISVSPNGKLGYILIIIKLRGPNENDRDL